MTRLRLAVGLVLVLAFATGCGLIPRRSAETPANAPGGHCAIPAETRPLALDWPPDERQGLEAKAKSGMVAVAYTGCSVRILAQCEVPGRYQYRALTPSLRRMSLRDSDQLHAALPLAAASLEGRLHSAGELTVNMNVVGHYAADRSHVRRDELKGDCDAATHVVHGFSVGAFEFFAGGDEQASASAAMFGAQAGGGGSSRREVLHMDGVLASCSTPVLGGPPSTCAAPIRVEVIPIGQPKEFEPVCSAGTTWDGENCVRDLVLTSMVCPAGANWDGKKCMGAAPMERRTFGHLTLLSAGFDGATGIGTHSPA